MERQLTEAEKLAVAKSHVATLKGFYVHLVVFVAVMTGLAVADYAKGETWWVQWPLIGWGIGILGHAYMVFGGPRPSTSEWEQRKIKDYISKM